MLKERNYDEIIAFIATLMGKTTEELENYPMGGYSKGRTSGAYKYTLLDLMKNISRYDMVYSLMSDEKSRFVFLKEIQYRIFPDNGFLESMADNEDDQYFDSDIIQCDENEIFVDCGGFIGDTVLSYMSHCGKYKKIYVYEPSKDNLVQCRQNLESYENIVIRNCGVGENCAELSFGGKSSSSSFMGICSTDDNADKVEIVSLDANITEPVTYIKMDIEGFEIPAILGAKNHIKNNSPKLAICTYHIISDMWEIPLLIKNINPDYRFYMRHYRADVNWETVVYAVVPQEKEKPVVKSNRKAIAFPWMEGWRNVELTKDCGLIPYLLQTNHSFTSYMVGKNLGDYPYADTFVKGIHMDFLPNGTEQEKFDYIRKNAKDIDLLLVRGAYDCNVSFTRAYKLLNPNGKVYLGLDANSAWMDRILWDRPEYIAFMESCDVIATSCRAMQKHLNEKWPWKIEYVPNGFYDFTGDHKAPDFAHKENILLTVARIGSAQKANDAMLRAFAMIADRIPEWSFVLVGSIDPGFEGFISDFFQNNQSLQDRVIFTGPITDKKELYRYYERAKIFTLTSTFEGGTPNVIAEALAFGCATLVTKFDAWEDAIDSGNCGVAAAIGDIDGIAAAMLSLCTDSSLECKERRACEYYKENYDMEKIVAHLEESLFGGDRA